MAKQQTYDATKMGPLSWRQLQLANQEAYANLDIDDDLRSALQQVTNNMSIPNSGSPEINWEGRVQSPIMRNSNGRDYWGKSMWDEQVADANDFYNNLSDLRGQNQPWYAQLGAGLLKGVTTAATTWLDGTVGLLYGIGSAIHNGDNKTGWDRAAQIFHNDVSNALQDFNEFMEEFAPNYKSRDEENNKWYQNMGTMNFWADGLIKNLGFTVGAFYSGGAFTKAIKGVGGLIAAGKAGKAAKAYKATKVKELMEAGMSAEEAAKAVNPMATATRYTNTLNAIEGARSGTGTAVAGSLFSAVNEGRIEANQVYRDAFTLGNTPEESKGAAAEILAARNRKMQEIEDNPTLLPSEKQALQAQVQANSQKLLAEAEQNAAKAGMLTLGLNIPILTIDNFKMYGRLYSRGFKQSVKQVGNNVTTQELKAAQEAVKNATTKQEKEAAKRALKEAERKAKAAHNARNNARIDDVAENVTDKEGRLAWNEITKGQAAWKGIKSGLMEGNEEMMQAWASGTAGNMTMPEDPDAYYKALTDPNAAVKTNDFLTSVTKGFLDSYGNGDRWEEGAIGFLTGILGMPTFGTRANSDSNTYLGRGKMVGLSGGLFGEFSNANYLNRLGVESVKNLNAFRDKYKQHAQFLAQSQAFTDAMDGYLQDKNEFAYNNARDNDDYAMIQALAVTGRIDEVKAMLNFKEEDLTDEILDSIANDFTENSNLVDSDGNPKTVDDNGKPLQGAWRDKAGNLMSRTDEGKAEMKAKLLEKQKRLNEEIDDYVASLDSVRAQVNNSLDESQVRELAWLDWKNKQWSRRFQDMQGEQAKAFELLISKATDEMKDFKPESDTYKALSDFKELIEKAQKAKSPIELLAALAKNNAFLDAMSKKVGKVAREQEGGIYQIADEFLGDLITSDEEGLNAIETVGKVLGDIRLMAIAQKQFKEKLDEYTSNPAKLAANRQKIENERQQQRDVTDTINQTSELSSKKLRDFLDMDDDAFDTAAQNPILAEMEGVDLSTKENKAAFEEAKKIRKKRQDLLNKINSSDKLNAEQKKNATALIQAAYNSATSLTNFTTLSNEAYNDPNNVPIPNKEGMSSDEIAEYQQDIVDSMQQVLGSIINEDDSALDLPSTEEAKEAAKNGVEAEFNFNDEHNTTGNSKVATPSESENERVERENEEKAKKEADKKRKDELNNFIEELTEVFGPKDKRDKAKTFLWDIANGFISSYLKEGEFPKKDQSVNGAKASNAFNGLLSLCENNSQTDWVNSVIIEKLYDKVRQLYDPIAIAQAEKEKQEKAKREQKKQDEERENPATIVLIESTADDIANKISNKVNKEQKDWQKEHQYWKHTTTEYGIGEKAYEKGNYTKFSDRAQSMDYSPELKKKIAAVAKYFEDNGVWDRINSGDDGKVAAGRKVGFKIDPKLNEDAGEVIILLTDEDGNVIGDLDSYATNQANLSKFVEYVKNQFEKFSAEHKGEVFVLTQPNSNRPLVTKITQCMIGKVPYGDEYITLNEANDTNIDDDNKNHKYYLGIAVADADGNVIVKATAQKVGSLGYIDRQIKQPIIEKNDGLVAGTPFLLVKSEGSNSYMCVPIITPTFDSEHYDEIMNSAYGSVIRKYIGDIEAIVKNQGPTYKNLTQEQKPFRIKEILNDLFVGKFYVEYNKSNNTYTFKVNNSDFYANVSFEDEAPEGTNKFSVEDLLQSISGHSLGLQISRKYINGNNPRHNEKGQQINFNKAIGSIAKVNIMPMSRLQKQDGQHTSYLHTVDDWFTLNPLLVSTDVSGKVTIKAQEVEAPVSVGSNRTPKAVTNMKVTIVGKDEKTGNNKEITAEVSVDYEGKAVFFNERKLRMDVDGRTRVNTKEAENLLKIARTAYAIEKARREGATKTVETSWGTFDLETNTFVNDTSVSTNNTISDTATDDDLFNMLAADNAQIQAESTPTTEQQPAAQQTSEQQPTAPQVSEQAPSTEIAQGETVQEPTPQETKQEVEQKPVENPVQLPTAQEVLEAKPEEVEKAAKELYTDICGKNGEKIYDALTPEQRSAIANSDSQDAILERLRDEFKKGKFKKDVDSIIAEYDTKYSRVTEEEREVWDREKELAWLKKALPQLSNEQRVQIVDGLIKIKNSDNPGYAWGQFCRGLITISSEAASGTLYHEAFHAVIDLLMTEDEYNKLFDAAYQVYGNLGMLGLEEKLAEEFRKFVQYGDNAAFVDYDAEDIKTPIIRGIVRLFRRLKALIQGLSNKQIYLNKLFYDINKGKFADRKVQEGRNLQPKFDINERELEDIKKKAIADGTFMKAPNGKPTNLNERQWLQVRTKAFKDWFGDWEELYNYTLTNSSFNKYRLSKDISIEEYLRDLKDNLNSDLYDAEQKVKNSIKNYEKISATIQYKVLKNKIAAIDKEISFFNTLFGNKDLSKIKVSKSNIPDILGRYNPYTHQVTYTDSSFTTVFHEIIHALTYNKYFSDDVFKKELDDIYDYVNNNKPKDTDYLKVRYALSHPTELIAELANPNVRNWLQKIPSKESIIDKLINLLREVLGIDTNKERTALDDLISFLYKNGKIIDNEFNINSVSKVVDENGEPLVVWHGTRFNFTVFNTKEREGSYFTTDRNYAGNYAIGTFENMIYDGGKPNLSTYFLSIRNPKYLNEINRDTVSAFRFKTLNDNDGIIGHDTKQQNIDPWDDFRNSEGTEFVAFNPNQIKSATDNVGTFSRENDDIRYSRVKTELDNKVAEFTEAINKSIAETITLNRYAQNWDYVNKGIPVKKPDASDNDGRKAYFGIKNPMHFYKGQWTISNGASKQGGKSYHEAVKNEVFRRLAMVDMLDKFNALFDVTWNDATNHYVINLKAPEKIATLSEIVDFDSIPDDVLADMVEEDNKKVETREKEILDGATKHTTILFEGKTKIGLGKLFENMISAGVNRNKAALYRNILDRLGELKNIEVEISDNKDSRFSNGKAAGWYFPSSNNIALLNNLDDSFLEDSIVHEALHAVVANTVKDKEKSDKVVAIVEGIKKAVLEEYGVKSIDDIQDSGIRRLFYGLTNADEFISEFFSNSEFHDYVKNKQATWYNRFIDFINSIFGLDVDITKVVKDLLSDFNGQIQEVRQTISMQNQLGTIFKDIADLSKQVVRPQESTEKQEPSIKQYHIQNLMYENLSEEDKEYIKEKGLSEEEYDDFSMTEKENLWYCR